MLIQTQSDLDKFVKNIPDCDFITVDTEFLRDKTYYPKLCLVQIGIPDGDDVAIDPLAQDMDLSGVFELFTNQNIVKVFHAPRQDLEIFYMMMGTHLPTPIFDTQIAASFLGYGAQVGYNNLVQKICQTSLDKSRQFMDWSQRPLTKAQLKYALADVSYLKKIYVSLCEDLREKGRMEWVEEETKYLSDPSLYASAPEDAWERIKIRTQKSEDLIALKELAAWREALAQKRNIPKQHILKDEVLAQLAMIKPQQEKQLKRIRNLPSGYQKGPQAENLMNLIFKALETPKDTWPSRKPFIAREQNITGICDMLKLLLKLQSLEHDIASNLIASSGDIEKLAESNDANIPALSGWRYEVFGKEAIELKEGRLSLGLKGGNIQKYYAT